MLHAQRLSRDTANLVAMHKPGAWQTGSGATTSRSLPRGSAHGVLGRARAGRFPGYTRYLFTEALRTFLERVCAWARRRRCAYARPTRQSYGAWGLGKTEPTACSFPRPRHRLLGAN